MRIKEKPTWKKKTQLDIMVPYTREELLLVEKGKAECNFDLCMLRYQISPFRWNFHNHSQEYLTPFQNLKKDQLHIFCRSEHLLINMYIKTVLQILFKALKSVQTLILFPLLCQINTDFHSTVTYSQCAHIPAGKRINSILLTA